MRNILDLTTKELEEIILTGTFPPDVSFEGIEDRPDYEKLYKLLKNPSKMGAYLSRQSPKAVQAPKEVPEQVDDLKVRRLTLKERELELKQQKAESYAQTLKAIELRLRGIELSIQVLHELLREKEKTHGREEEGRVGEDVRGGEGGGGEDHSGS